MSKALASKVEKTVDEFSRWAAGYERYREITIGTRYPEVFGADSSDVADLIRRDIRLASMAGRLPPGEYSVRKHSSGRSGVAVRYTLNLSLITDQQARRDVKEVTEATLKSIVWCYDRCASDYSALDSYSETYQLHDVEERYVSRDRKTCPPTISKEFAVALLAKAKADTKAQSVKLPLNDANMRKLVSSALDLRSLLSQLAALGFSSVRFSPRSFKKALLRDDSILKEIRKESKTLEDAHNSEAQFSFKAGKLCGLIKPRSYFLNESCYHSMREDFRELLNTYNFQAYHLNGLKYSTLPRGHEEKFEKAPSKDSRPKLTAKSFLALKPGDYVQAAMASSVEAKDFYMSEYGLVLKVSDDILYVGFCEDRRPQEDEAERYTLIVKKFARRGERRGQVLVEPAGVLPKALKNDGWRQGEEKESLFIVEVLKKADVSRLRRVRANGMGPHFPLLELDSPPVIKVGQEVHLISDHRYYSSSRSDYTVKKLTPKAVTIKGREGQLTFPRETISLKGRSFLVGLASSSQSFVYLTD